MNLLSLLRRSKSQPESPEAFYSLDHALLNIPLPPPTMWMNLGYWKDTDDFPTACAALLDQVLIIAGLLGEDGCGIGIPEGKRVHLVDVGIGCGDQSLRALGYTRDSSGLGLDEKRGNDRDEVVKTPLFDSYVGITSLPVQAHLAKSRVEDLQGKDLAKQKQKQQQQQQQRAQIFCANAADPSSWSPELKSSLPLPTAKDSNPDTPRDLKEESKDETWLLALDTLYHFTPSRAPLFTYANTTLQASVTTFDLLLPNPKPTFLQRLLLLILCFFAGTPYSNFLTEDEYTSLLVDAGYDREKVSFRDISEHVFPGIEGFIKRRGEVSRMFGVGKGMGKFKGAGKIFGWWARSGVVRGVVVVARV